MKKIGMFLVTAVIMTVFLGADWVFAGRIAHRQMNQRNRIEQGIENRELTRQEVGCLEKQQNRINRQKRKAWQDGKLTQKERIHLERAQDRSSRQIFRFKHNDIVRQYSLLFRKNLCERFPVDRQHWNRYD